MYTINQGTAIIWGNMVSSNKSTNFEIKAFLFLQRSMVKLSLGQFVDVAFKQ